MNSVFLPTVSEELLAAWLDGNVTPAQDAYITQMCAVDPALQDIMDANDDVETTYEELLDNGFELPYELTTEFILPEVPEAVYAEVSSQEDNDSALYEHDHTTDDDYQEELSDSDSMDGLDDLYVEF